MSYAFDCFQLSNNSKGPKPLSIKRKSVNIIEVFIHIPRLERWKGIKKTRRKRTKEKFIFALSTIDHLKVSKIKTIKFVIFSWLVVVNMCCVTMSIRDRVEVVKLLDRDSYRRSDPVDLYMTPNCFFGFGTVTTFYRLCKRDSNDSSSTLYRHFNDIITTF